MLLGILIAKALAVMVVLAFIVLISFTISEYLDD
ncbi:hypothetical protein SAMN04487787_101628 [Kosakonia sacchari]|nr:hypothetical protein SAMN04487787_101628 [Kosakonia sacchari]